MRATPWDGHLYPIAKVGLTQAFDSAVKFVGYHCQFDPGLIQTVQQLQHTGVWSGAVLHIQQVVGPEISQTPGLQFFRGSLGHGTVNEQAYAVAHKAAYLIQRAGGQFVEGQSIVGTVGQILKGIQQGAVQIENHGGIGNHNKPPYQQWQEMRAVRGTARIVGQ